MIPWWLSSKEPTANAGDAVGSLSQEEAREKEKRANVSVNWPQAVLRVRFEAGVGEEQLEMEEANEGEKN